MSLTYKTARLNVSEITGDVEQPELSSLLTRIPALLTPSVVESLPPYFHGILSPADAKGWLDRMLSESRLWVVRHHDSDDVIGFVFAFIENDCDAHIGYLFGEAYWGQGLATELLKGFITQAVSERNWTTLIGGVDKGNIASSKLLTKLGFVEQTGSDGLVVFYEYQLAQQT